MCSVCLDPHLAIHRQVALRVAVVEGRESSPFRPLGLELGLERQRNIGLAIASAFQPYPGTTKPTLTKDRSGSNPVIAAEDRVPGA